MMDQVSQSRATAHSTNPPPSGQTPKAFANFSPGLERSDNPGDINPKFVSTLKGFLSWRTLSGFIPYFVVHSQG
jgi:hypothetical protein